MKDLLQRSLAGVPPLLAIGGAFVPSAAGKTTPSEDPGTGETLVEFAAGDAEDIDRAVRAARAALAGPWSRARPAERGRVLARAADLLREEADRFAVVETLDQGKRLSEARGDVAGVARAFEFYAGACDKLHGETLPLGPDHLAFTIHEPIGVVAQIVPWNYPLSTLARGLAPALAAGCAVVVKPAEQTPLTALMLADLLARAGAPAGIVNVVTGTGLAAGAALTAHPGVDHITFTGSVATGAAVTRAAASNATRLTLELGGKSPLVVLADADLDAAIEGCLGGIFENAGQICSAAARLIVERPIHAAFVERLAKHARAMKLGHGLRDLDMGPLNSRGQLDRVAGFIARARARGLRPICGGDPARDPETGAGWFHQPTIFDDLPPGDELVAEEVFGPVLAVQIADSVDHAIELANGTAYALVAGIYARDFSTAHRLARAIDAGQIYINEYFAGGIETPFGGNRRSGFGREKGVEALRAYSKLKSVAARI